MPLPGDLLALLNACRADPVSDLPRLVLADWLDERDDPARAEFLRVQCELARPSLDAERVAELKARERALIDANWRAWAGGLHEVCCDIIDAENLARNEATMSDENRARRGDALSRTEPIRRNDLRAIKMPWEFTRGLLQLTVTPERLTSQGVRRWANTTEAGWLESLRLPLYNDALVSIGDAVRVPRKLASRLGIELVLSEVNEATAEAIRPYTGGASWDRIRYLTVVNQGENPALPGVLGIASFAQVTHLGLVGPRSDPTATVLSRKKFTRLISLDVGGANLPPETLIAFAIRTPRLNVLRAWRTPLGDRSFAALVATSWGETLHTLEIMNCDLGDDAMTALVRSGLLGRLCGPQLNLSMNRVADAGLATLAGSEDLLRFGELVLRENRVGDAGVEALAASPFAASLRYLDLWKNRLTDRAAVALAASPHLGQLRDLNVRDNALTDAGRAALTARYGAVAKVGF